MDTAPVCGRRTERSRSTLTTLPSTETVGRGGMGAGPALRALRSTEASRSSVPLHAGATRLPCGLPMAGPKVAAAGRVLLRLAPVADSCHSSQRRHLCTQLWVQRIRPARICAGSIKHVRQCLPACCQCSCGFLPHELERRGFCRGYRRRARAGWVNARQRDATADGTVVEASRQQQ